jgi:hypothetical protein
MMLASSSITSRSGMIDSLCGIVTLIPPNSIVINPCKASFKDWGSISKALIEALRPKASNAVLCMSGESEWPIGCPMIPYSFRPLGWFMAENSDDWTAIGARKGWYGASTSEKIEEKSE